MTTWTKNLHGKGTMEQNPEWIEELVALENEDDKG